MAAGLGFKTFTTGEVLTAADVNGYLMQGILVFATEAARNSAITSPQEGQFAFTKDNNSLWYYDGAAWVASGATGDIEGVTAGVGISGGGTSGTVTITNSMATAIDAKGDLVPGTGADTFSRLAVGANGTVLTADSAEATGLKWATPASGGGMTLLNSGGTALSSTSTTVNITPTGYVALKIYIKGAYMSSDERIGMRLNGDTGGNYSYTVTSTHLTTNSSLPGNGTTSFEYITRGNPTAATTLLLNNADIDLQFPNDTDFVTIQYQSIGGSAVGTFWQQSGGGVYDGTAAITSITFLAGGGATFSGGTIFVYGVK